MEIVKPGTPAWVTAAVPGGKGLKDTPIVGAVGFAVIAAIVVPLAVIRTPLVGILMLVLASLVAVGVIIAGAVGGRAIVGPPNWKINGEAISGGGRELLQDIAARYGYAKRMVAEVPTGIEWSDVNVEVQVLLWDAAEHAARVSALDKDLTDLQYAEAGTPQRAYRDEIARRRDEHFNAMKATQREADQLARLAGNAAAAAKVALARTGSVYDLEVVAPSARVVRAQSAIEHAKERLAMLIDVWTDLDQSATLLAERIDAEARTRLPARPSPPLEARPPRRPRRPRT